MDRTGRWIAVAAVVVLAVAAFAVGRISTDGGTPSPSGTPVSSAIAAASVSPTRTANPPPTPSASAVPGTPAPAMTPAPTAPPAPEAPPATAGWTRIGELAGASTGDTTPAATFTGRMPKGDSFLLLTLTCAGGGTLRIAAGTDARDIDCAEAAVDAWRMLAFIDEDGPFTASVGAAGSTSWRVRLDHAPTPMPLPAITIGGDARMRSGCGVTITTAWGYSASDSCATTIPEKIDTTTASGGAVRMALPEGWTITGADVACGRLDTKETSLPHFATSARCDVTTSVRGDRTVRVTGLPDAARPWLLELWVEARNEAGDRFSGPYYAFVRT